MHADQWVYMSDVTATKNPHLYSAISLGDHNTRFYADTREKVQYSSRNGQIGQLQFGGYQNGSQPGWGFIAEVLVYDHGVNADVRNSVETYLNAKYGLNGLDAPAPDLTTHWHIQSTLCSARRQWESRHNLEKNYHNT